MPLEKLSYYFPIKKFVVIKKVFRVTTTLASGRPPTASLQLFRGFLAPRAHLRLLVAADIKVFGGFQTISALFGFPRDPPSYQASTQPFSRFASSQVFFG